MFIFNFKIIIMKNILLTIYFFGNYIYTNIIKEFTYLFYKIIKEIIIIYILKNLLNRKDNELNVI